MTTATAELVCVDTMTLPDGTVVESNWNLRRVDTDGGAAHRLRPVELTGEDEQAELHPEADAALARAGWYRTGPWTAVDGHNGVTAPEMLAAPVADATSALTDTLDYTALPGWTPGPGGLTAHRALPDGARLELSGPYDHTGYLVEGTDREGKTFRRFVRGGQAALADADRIARYLPDAPRLRVLVRAAIRADLERSRRAGR